jgi:hypothetical protein
MSDDFGQVITEARAALDQIAKETQRATRPCTPEGRTSRWATHSAGFARGWQQVVEQLERAASHYRDGETTGFETVMQLVTPELARWRSSA